MSGRYLRRGEHRCDPPRDGRVRDVWQCDCGRRWTCTASAIDSPHLDPTVEVVWHRRWWPWPRPDPAADDGEDIDAMVDRMLGRTKAAIDGARSGRSAEYYRLITDESDDHRG